MVIKLGGAGVVDLNFLVLRAFHLDGQRDSEPTHGDTHQQVAVAHQLLPASAINQESLKQTKERKIHIYIFFFSIENKVNF